MLYNCNDLQLLLFPLVNNCNFQLFTFVTRILFTFANDNARHESIALIFY